MKNKLTPRQQGSVHDLEKNFRVGVRLGVRPFFQSISSKISHLQSNKTPKQHMRLQSHTIINLNCVCSLISAQVSIKTFKHAALEFTQHISDSYNVHALAPICANGKCTQLLTQQFSHLILLAPLYI